MIVWLVIAFYAGAFVGFFAAALCASAAHADLDQEGR